ncbi:MAG: hypothetical protein IK079_04175 [Desulfovibrio sp.]|nr:hypothetical protein [Desulfovibrio sp.]
MRTLILLCLFSFVSPYVGSAQILPKNYALPLEDALIPWLENLSPNQREAAKLILQQSQPKIHELQKKLRLKLTELQALRFDQHFTPESLPKLGKELQLLRQQLATLYTTLELQLSQLSEVPKK